MKNLATNPLQCDYYEDVTIIPGKLWNAPTAAYSKSKKVPFSGCFLPWKSQAFPPNLIPQNNLEIEAIYGGVFKSSFGHFFGETLDRLWFAQKNPHLPIIFASKKTVLKTWMQEIFEILNIKNEIIFCDVPTKVCKMHFPTPLIMLSTYITCDYKHFLGKYVAPPIEKGKKIFISRGRNNSGYVNNEELERYAIDSGYVILEPEKISMRERLYAFGTAESILAAEGSSLYSLGLIKNLKATVYVIPRQMDMSIAAITPNVKYLEIKRQCLVMNRNPGFSLFSLDISSVDEAMKKKKYVNLNLPSTIITNQIIKQDLETLNQHIDWLDSIIAACFTTNDSERIHLLHKSVEQFCSNPKNTSNQNLTKEEDGIQFTNPFFCFLTSINTMIGSIKDKKNVSDTIVKILKYVNTVTTNFQIPAFYYELMRISYVNKILNPQELLPIINNFIKANTQHYGQQANFTAKILLMEIYHKLNDAKKLSLILEEIDNKAGADPSNVPPALYLDRLTNVLLERKEYSTLIKFLEKHSPSSISGVSHWYRNLSRAYTANNDKSNALLYAYKAFTFNESADANKNILLDTLIKYENFVDADNFLQTLRWNGDNSDHYKKMLKRLKNAKDKYTALNQEKEKLLENLSNHNESKLNKEYSYMNEELRNNLLLLTKKIDGMQSILNRRLDKLEKQVMIAKSVKAHTLNQVELSNKNLMKVANVSLIKRFKYFICEPLIKKRAFMLCNNSRNDEGKKYIEKVIKEMPNLAWPYYILGKIQWQMGQKKISLKSIQKAIHIDNHTEYFKVFQRYCYKKLTDK